MSPLCVARRSVLVSVALLWPVLAYAIDVDWDGIDDALDNCPSLWNAGQLNSDGDAHGDRCDDDDDNDGIFDDADNCTIYPNGDQYDSNADGFGNRCDGDLNGSLTVNLADQFLFNEAFALSPEPEPLVLDADCNHDYVVGAPDIPCFMAELEKKFPGPSWTSDTDGGGPDGVKDYADNCVGVANPEQEDSDADGLGDACDEDDDGDGVADDADNCLGRPNPLQQDTNADGFGNACDPDWTNDGSVGSLDYALVGVHFGHQQRDALDFDISTDGSGGVGAPSLALVNQYWALPAGPSALGANHDGDGWLDGFDNCVMIANPDGADTDGDGLGDACEPDPPLGFDPDSFTVVFLPDTQEYTGTNSIPTLHSEWICRNRWNLNIVFASQLGDVANHWSLSDQYEKIRSALGILDRCDVPWGVVPGNHDVDETDGKVDYSAYRNFFPSDRWVGFPWFGGASPELPGCVGPNNCEEVNTFQLFDTRLGFSILHIGIEWHSWQAGLPGWVTATIAEHNLPTMLSTHAYVGGDPGNCGEAPGLLGEFFTNMVAPSSNSKVFFTANGHFGGCSLCECELEKTNDGGRVVSLFADYQWSPEQGWLRYCQFSRGNDTAVCDTYSPLLGQFRPESHTVHTGIGLDARAPAPPPP